MYNYNNMYPCADMSFSDFPGACLRYWVRSLYQRLTALINIDKLPEGTGKQYGWDIDALKYGLFFLGYLAVFKSKTYGVVPQPGTITGIGLQYQPTGVMIATPYFQFTEPLRIGYNTELIKLTPDFTGVMDIVTKYAYELTELDISIRSSARNSRLAYVLAAYDDKSAKTLKGVRERVLNGEDAIIDDKLLKKNKADSSDLPWFQFDGQLKNNFILTDLIESRRSTLVDFYREIGVRMLDNKKERMVTGEVAAGQAETFIRSEVWIEALKTSVEKVNKMFGTSIEVSINMPDFIGGENNVSESDIPGRD